MRNILRLFAAVLAAAILPAQVLPPVQPTPLQVSRMSNVGNDQVIDNRSSFIAQSNYIGFCGTGTGFWSVQFQYADASSSGPWTTPGGSATVSNFSTTCVGAFLGYHNWCRFHVTGSAVVKYSAVKDFWMPQAGGQVSTTAPVVPYVTNASTSPMLIPASIHGQGANVVVTCFSGPLTVDFHVTGLWVACQVSNDGQGNVTITYFDGTVGSVMVTSAGPGPPGPAGTGATPYVTAATTSPQTIAQTVHGQGFNPITVCFSGAPIGSIPPNQHVTGTQYPCTVAMDNTGSGNVTVSWPGSAVGSIMIQTSGRPAPYTANATTSPMSIPIATHNQGFNAAAKCYDGPVSAGVVTGNEVVCAVARNSGGDITVIWAGNSVISISIQ